MLKDIILEKLKNSKNEDRITLDLKGEVEIKAWKDGNLIYHDGGDNTVTIWAKHSLIHLLTGDVLTSFGDRVGIGATYYSKPQVNISNHNGTSLINLDGTMLSGEPYFWDYTKFVDYIEPVSRTSVSEIFPLFPTKIAFGTGFEFDTYANVPADFKSYYLEDYPTQAIFEANVTDDYNYLSNTVSSQNLVKTRTLNDIVTGPLPDINYSEDYCLDGIIKNCFAEKVTDTNHIYFKQGTTGDIYNLSNDTVFPVYKGLGRPCPIYCKRTENRYSPSSEITISNDIVSGPSHDSRISYTCVLPTQELSLGTVESFYPYNGYTLKEIGLYCDSLFAIEGAVPTIGGTGYETYNCMPMGIMFAKRNIKPLTKDPNVKVSVAWSIYTS